jgi:hypothetical protein
VLAGIVTTPVFGRGGTLLTEPGYHPDARLFTTPHRSRRRRSRAATAGQIAEARSLLLDDLLGDFPFTSVAERAHAVACRWASCAPCRWADAASPDREARARTGATLMVDAIATILTGAGVPSRPRP